MVSRRTLLLGGLGAAALAVSGTAFAVEENVVPGRIRSAELTGQCEIDATPAASRASVVTSGSFASSARRRTVGWSVATPPGIALDGLPVALVLHGRSEDHTAPFTHLRLQDFLAASVLGGGRPFALASIDGGDTYWHPRRDGDDPIAMLDDEYCRFSEDWGLRTDGIAVMGWSMGGYGALLLARQSHRQRLQNPHCRCGSSAARRCSLRTGTVRRVHSMTTPTSRRSGRLANRARCRNNSALRLLRHR